VKKPFRLGLALDDPDANAPEVDWDARDIQISKPWSEAGVRKWLDLPPDAVIYKALVPLSDIDEKLVEEEDGGSEEDYDWSELQSRRSSPPPIVVTRKLNGNVEPADGNHRTRFWRNSEFEEAPAWVYDEIATAHFRENTLEKRLERAHSQFEGVEVKRDSERLFTSENFPKRAGVNYLQWAANGRLVTEQGTPSALEEHEYRQVRTETFKEWFGDWQKAPTSPSEGMVRLYRGEGRAPNETIASLMAWTRKPKDQQENGMGSGRWFNADMGDAMRHNRIVGRPDAPVSWVDVPAAALESLHVDAQPDLARFVEKGMEAHTYFLPKDLAKSRKPMPDCSRIVDPVSGEPWVASHGTCAPEQFAEFNVGEARSLGDDDDAGVEWGSGPDPSTFLGAHFARERSVADKFAKGLYSRVNTEGGRVYSVFLNIRAPKRFGSDEEIQENLYSQDVNSRSVDMEMDGQEDPDSWGTRYTDDGAFREAQNRKIIHGIGDNEEALEFAGELAESFRGKLQEDGYDGIVHVNTVEGGVSYVAFDPAQIKSATGNNGMFDPEDARIYDAETPCLPGQAEEFDEPVVSVSLPPPPIGMAADAGVPLAPAL